MEIERISLGVIGGLLAGAAVWIFKMGRRIGKIEGHAEEMIERAKKAERTSKKAERMSNTMWAFQKRRGIVEALEKNMIESPTAVSLTEVWRRRFAKLKDPLLSWYKAQGRDLDPDELFEQIEANFGQQIVDEICVPFRLKEASCLVAAVLLIRENLVD